MHAHAIARLTSIKRGNTSDAVRSTIFMRIPSLVQTPGTDCMQAVRTPADHCSRLVETGIETCYEMNSGNRDLLQRLIVRDEELDSGFGGTGEVDCVGGFDVDA